MTRDRVVLVGFMASGKTTVGAELARLLGWAFRDMDLWIEERTGRSVAELFRERGEAGFREEERRAAEEAAVLVRHVVAAGGGAFAFSETRRALQAGAVSVWLKCDVDTVLRRLPDGAVRPLAANHETIRRLFAEREPSYRLADLAVETAACTPEEVARRVAAALFPVRSVGTGGR